MVYRWECRHCDWVTWTASRHGTLEEGKSHLVSHHQSEISRSSFGVEWNCPYCDQSGRTQDASDGVERFRNHLFGHAESLVESDKHVAEDIDGTGSILVLSALEATGAENARKHFLSAGDVVIFVTPRPAERIRLVVDELGDLPSKIVVVTTVEDPFEDLSRDPSKLPVEAVQIGGTNDLATLGQKISKILGEYETTAGKISFEFDVLSDLVRTFDLQQVFEFLHVLIARLEDARALSHFYASPRRQSEATVNVLTQLFDLKLTTNENVFVSEP